MGILGMLGLSSGNLNIRINTGRMKSYAEQLEEINKDIASLEDELIENISSLESEISSAKAQNSSNDEDDSDIDTSAWEDELYKCNVFKNILCSSMYNMVLSRCTKGMIKTAEEFENVELQLSQFDFKTSAQIFTAGTANSQNNKESIPITNDNDGSIISTSNMNEAELYEYFVKNVFKSDGAIVDEHKKLLEFDLWIKDNYGKTDKISTDWTELQNSSFILMESLTEAQKEQLKKGKNIIFTDKQIELITKFERTNGGILEKYPNKPLFNSDKTLITMKNMNRDELKKWYIDNNIKELTGESFDKWLKNNYHNYESEDKFKTTDKIVDGVSFVPVVGDVIDLGYQTYRWYKTGKADGFYYAAIGVAPFGDVAKIAKKPIKAVFKSVDKIKYADEISSALKIGKKTKNLSNTIEGVIIKALPNGNVIKKVKKGEYHVINKAGEIVKKSYNIDDVVDEAINAGKLGDVGVDSIKGGLKFNEPVKIKTNKGIEVEFKNPSGNDIKWVEQNPKNIPNAIESAKNSKDIGKAIEGKVGDFVSQKTDVTGFGQEVLDKSGGKVTDLDVFTDKQIIEVKNSASAIKIDQIDRLTDPTNPKFFNYENKEVIVYIEESIKEITNPQTLEKINYLKNKEGVVIVNSLEELEGVLK